MQLARQRVYEATINAEVCENASRQLNLPSGSTLSPGFPEQARHRLQEPKGQWTCGGGIDECGGDDLSWTAL